jgi:hypothetical protein
MSSISTSLRQPTHLFRLVAFLLLLMFVGNLVGVSWYLWFVGMGGLAVCLGVLFLVDAVLCGKVELLLLVWVVVFPLGYYYLSIPRADPIVSFDRLLIPCLGLACLLAPANPRPWITPEIRIAEGAWLLFLLAAMLSLVHLSNPIGGSKLLFDSFVLPAILGYVVIQNAEPRRWAPALHFTVCLFCIYSALIGLAEVILDTDLLPLPGDIYYTSVESGILIPRVNGPFPTITSFMLIGLTACIFLCFLWRLISHKPLWLRIFHAAGLAASVTMASLPFFRSMFLTMAIILLIDGFVYQRRLKARLVRFSLLGVFVLAGVVAQLAVPEAFENRVDPANLYQRIAQQQQTLGIFLANPVTGIGLGNFLAYAANTSVTGTFANYDAANAAHNTFGQILAETGVLGALPYLMAQVFFLLAGWRLLRETFAWKYFLYIFLTYWISGMALSSGYFEDLNLFYVLAGATMLSLGRARVEDASLQLKPFREEGNGSSAFEPA